VLVQRNAMYREAEQKSMEEFKRRQEEQVCAAQGEQR
jgi:hypothetical protein